MPDPCGDHDGSQPDPYADLEIHGVIYRVVRVRPRNRWVDPGDQDPGPRVDLPGLGAGHEIIASLEGLSFVARNVMDLAIEAERNADA